MSEIPPPRMELITGVAGRQRFTDDQKLSVVADFEPGATISYVACRHGLSPGLVFRSRRLMSEGALANAPCHALNPLQLLPQSRARLELVSGRLQSLLAAGASD